MWCPVCVPTIAIPSRITASERLPSRSILTSPASSAPSFSNWMTGTVRSGAPSSSLAGGPGGERAGNDHHPAGMEREMPGRAHQRGGDLRELDPAGGEVESRVVGMLDQQPLDRKVVAVPGDPAGHLADLPRGAAVHLGHLAERAAELERVVVRH